MKKNFETITVSAESILKGKAADLFPLLCPVMEYKWVTNWKCNLIHCPNGRVEKGCVFSESTTALVLADCWHSKTTWTTVFHDPETYKVHYKLDNAVSSSLYKLEMDSDGEDTTRCRLELTYNPINEKGERILKNKGGEKINLMLTITLKMLKHYTECGEILKSDEVLKTVFQFKHFKFMDKFRFILNGIVGMLMVDEDRKRFLAGLPVSKTATQAER